MVSGDITGGVTLPWIGCDAARLADGLDIQGENILPIQTVGICVLSYRLNCHRVTNMGIRSAIIIITIWPGEFDEYVP